MWLTCAKNNHSKKHVKLFIRAYSSIFCISEFEPNLYAYQCTHEKNHHHPTNYLSLDHSNFLI